MSDFLRIASQRRFSLLLKRTKLIPIAEFPAIWYRRYRACVEKISLANGDVGALRTGVDI